MNPNQGVLSYVRSWINAVIKSLSMLKMTVKCIRLLVSRNMGLFFLIGDNNWIEFVVSQNPEAVQNEKRRDNWRKAGDDKLIQQ